MLISGIFQIQIIWRFILNYTINDMLILNSEYLKVLNNWPDSEKNNYSSNRFICNDSTEVEPKTKIICNYTTKVEQENYTLRESYNSDLIQKFFMIKCGLYYKSKFLEYTYNIEKIYRRYCIENKYCIFLYSHSDYSDVWDLTFGQIKKHINLNKLTDKFFYENVRLSEDSILFPHIHSITYGKWVISNDSYNKFALLFKEYNINTDIRGVI